MINANENIINAFNSPIRTIKGKAEFNKGSALAITYSGEDNLKSIAIDRVGESGKFFGFGVCQKTTINLLDTNREISVNPNDTINISFGIDEEYITNYPTFYITDTARNETTNEITAIAHDKLFTAAAHTVAELALDAPYTIGEFAEACATLLGVELAETALDAFNTSYPTGANFEGTETIREALNAVAEATQTIYYLDRQDILVFKRLSVAEEPVVVIGKDVYFSLTNGGESILSDITSVTELGDNIGASLNIGGGVTQYVRDNHFWDLREDITTLVDNALTAIGGLAINQFTCSWRGNFLLEIGDRIGLITRDDETIYSFLLDDTTAYNGGFSQMSQWSYKEQNETASNPASLGLAVKQTYAKVDKANKEIEMLVSEVDGNNTDITSLKLATDGITASVASVREEVEGINESVNTLSSRVDLAITENDVTIAIQKELENGVDKVATGKGFTFDDTGLTVEDLSDTTNNTIKTTITNNGMTVYGNEEEVLVANDVGVQARNLHANTYLIIGTNSRFEDYGSRTGCFWIGG